MTKRSKSETWISSSVFNFREQFSFWEGKTSRSAKIVRIFSEKFGRTGIGNSWERASSLGPGEENSHEMAEKRGFLLLGNREKPRESKQQRFDKCEWRQLKWKAWKLRVARMQIRIERGYPGHHLGRTCFLFWHRWSTRFITVRAHLFISNPRREFLDSGFNHPTFSSFPSNRRVHCTGISIHRAEDRF